MYRQLLLANNWGSRYYVDALTGKRVTLDETARIQWPDGTEDMFVPLQDLSRSERVSDHGHSYDVTSVVKVFDYLLYGAKITKTLDVVKVWFEDTP